MAILETIWAQMNEFLDRKISVKKQNWNCDVCWKKSGIRIII